MTSKYTKDHFDSVVEYHRELEEFVFSNEISISNRMLSRHKALRLLSVLNRLALNHMHRTRDYYSFRKEYVALSSQARSLVCVIGLVLVFNPSIFRSIQSLSPKLRKILGKA